MTDKRRRYYPKVLIGTPSSEMKDYCWDEFISRVKSFSYPNCDFVIADNTQGRKHLKDLRRQNINVIEIKPKMKNIFNLLAESHDALRLHALKYGYQYLFHLESDIIPPQDVIERLLLHKKKIVAGCYFIGFGNESHLMLVEQEENYVNILEANKLSKGADFDFFDGGLKKYITQVLDVR